MPERMAILFLRKFGSQLSGRPHSAQRARTQDLFDIRKMSLEGIKLVFQIYIHLLLLSILLVLIRTITGHL